MQDNAVFRPFTVAWRGYTFFWVSGLYYRQVLWSNWHVSLSLLYYSMTLTLNKKDTQVEEAKTNDTLKLDSPEHICSNNTWQIYAFLLQRNAVMYQKWYRIWYDDNISTYKTKPTSTFMNLSVSITHSISLFSSWDTLSIFLKPRVCWSRPPKALIPCYHCDLSLASLCILSANLSIIVGNRKISVLIFTQTYY